MYGPGGRFDPVRLVREGKVKALCTKEKCDSSRKKDEIKQRRGKESAIGMQEASGGSAINQDENGGIPRSLP